MEAECWAQVQGSPTQYAPKKVTILLGAGQKIVPDIQELVYLNSVSEGFLSRLSAAIDVGYSLTKSNNLQQLTVDATIGYSADRWLEMVKCHLNIQS